MHEVVLLYPPILIHDVMPRVVEMDIVSESAMQNELVSSCQREDVISSTLRFPPKDLLLLPIPRSGIVKPKVVQVKSIGGLKSDVFPSQ